MTFETERLLLRPWTEEDAAALYELAKDPQVGPAAGWAPHTDVEGVRVEVLDKTVNEFVTFLTREEWEQRCQKK